MAEQELAQRLHIPESFTSKSINDSDVEEWNNSVQRILRNLSKQPIPETETVASVAQLAGQDNWLAHDTRRLAQGMYLRNVSVLPSHPISMIQTISNQLLPMMNS